MNNLWMLIASAIFLIYEGVEGKLPPAVQTICSRNDRKLAECILSSVKQIQPYLASGNLGDGFVIPPLEPFIINTLNIGKPNSDFQAAFQNLVIRGASKFRIDKMRVNLNDLKFDFIIGLPLLDIRGKYDLIFRLFGLSLKGKGDILAKFENVRARVSMRATKYFRNGQMYLRFEKFNIKIQPNFKKGIRLTNLFQGNPALEEIGNSFINSNSDFFLTDIYPGIENKLADIFTNAANQITGQASFDEMFPNT